MSPGASPSPTRVGEPAPLEIPQIPQAASLTPLHTGITTQLQKQLRGSILIVIVILCRS